MNRIDFALLFSKMQSGYFYILLVHNMCGKCERMEMTCAVTWAVGLCGSNRKLPVNFLTERHYFPYFTVKLGCHSKRYFVSAAFPSYSLGDCLLNIGLVGASSGKSQWTCVNSLHRINSGRATTGQIIITFFQTGRDPGA